MIWRFIPLVMVMLACQPQKNTEFTTFILVRHAEKDSDGTNDPPLLPAGIARASKLSLLLSEVPIDVIYSTPFKRTRETVNPIATDRNLKILSYEGNRLDEFAASLVKMHSGKTVLISGHSNTTPRLVNHLMGSGLENDLTEDEYDWVYVVDVTTLGNAKLKKLRFSP